MNVIERNYSGCCSMKLNKERYTELLRKEAESTINWYRQLKQAGNYAHKDKAYYKAFGEACVYADYLKTVS